MRTFWLELYCGLANKLPKSNRPELGEFSGWCNPKALSIDWLNAKDAF